MSKWLPVPSYEGRYEVSDDGQVRSLLRGGRVLKQSTSGGRYPHVSLSKDGVKTITVHNLVLEAFAGPRPVGLEALHRNGNDRDNRAANLVWGTRAQNIADQVEHGTHANARKMHCKHDHEYTEENTGWSRRGHRYCRTCKRIRNQNYKKVGGR